LLAMFILECMGLHRPWFYGPFPPQFVRAFVFLRVRCQKNTSKQINPISRLV
jgi:hypothetical protein